MKNCDAIIIGGSAGSLDVLLEVLPLIDNGIRFPIIIILHRMPGSDHLLSDLFASKARLTVKEIEEKEIIRNNIIYLAPSDYHLLIEKNHTFSLDHFEKVNYSRPSIDVAFQSAAEVYKNKLAGLLLSGANSDGVAGLQFIKKMGGYVMIQDPKSATVSYMPAKAQMEVEVDMVLEPANIAAFINQLSKNKPS